jgi:hypothetical protein
MALVDKKNDFLKRPDIINPDSIDIDEAKQDIAKRQTNSRTGLSKVKQSNSQKTAVFRGKTSQIGKSARQAMELDPGLANGNDDTKHVLVPSSSKVDATFPETQSPTHRTAPPVNADSLVDIKSQIDIEFKVATESLVDIDSEVNNDSPVNIESRVNEEPQVNGDLQVISDPLVEANDAQEPLDYTQWPFYQSMYFL